MYLILFVLFFRLILFILNIILCILLICIYYISSENKRENSTRMGTYYNSNVKYIYISHYEVYELIIIIKKNVIRYTIYTIYLYPSPGIYLPIIIYKYFKHCTRFQTNSRIIMGSNKEKNRLLQIHMIKKKKCATLKLLLNESLNQKCKYIYVNTYYIQYRTYCNTIYILFIVLV